MSLYLDIEKDLGSFRLQVKLEAGDETLALLGASGCGKSMTLRCIAGIEKPDRGRIVVDGVTLFDSEKGIDLPPQQRHTGLLLQNYALFPNMTVLQNLRAGARREKDRIKREEAVRVVLESFGLRELAGRYPHQLSGGQQQRVALGRILVSQPRILLLDEPFSALDSHLRFRLEQQVRQVIRQFGKTVLLVSHDRDEVFRMADSIAIMEDGSVGAVGTKAAVFAAPCSRSGALLTGCKNISSIHRLEDGRIFAEDWGVALSLPQFPPQANAIGLRMHGIRPGEGENTLRCRVVEEVENPFSYVLMLQPLEGECKTAIGWETDKDTWLRLKSEEVTVHLPAAAVLPLKN